MNQNPPKHYLDPIPYVPASLSEIYDLLGSMVLGAPTFLHDWSNDPDQGVDAEFHMLIEGLDRVRRKLSEERYAVMVDLAGRAKALFAADQDNTNGKTEEGLKLLYEMEDVLQEVRRLRVKEKLPDEEGEVTGD